MSMRKFKVAAVNYLNTKPFLYGIFNSPVSDQLDLSLDVPSECARMLEDGEVDFGLVPVAALADMNEYYLLSDFCIGAKGSVQTVGIFSEVPIEEIEKVYLDFHSRTSVELAKVLLKEYWHIAPRLETSFAGFEKTAIKGNTAGLVIGDKAIEIRDRYPFFYDFGKAWMAMTQLPFVFAVWVSRKPISDNFVNQFNAALQKGLDLIPQLLYILPAPAANFSLERYFTENISYDLDKAKMKGLQQFLSFLGDRRDLKIHSGETVLSAAGS
jgi:chorismate dehydratase